MDEALEVERFNVWKANLAVLGIPFMDVVRVMAGILLLGNVEFVEGNGLEVSVIGKEEMKSVSSLIGVSPQLLLQGLTSRTHKVRGQLVKSSSDANMSNATRDSLAKALYCRTVATIVKRANSLKRPVGALSGQRVGAPRGRQPARLHCRHLRVEEVEQVVGHPDQRDQARHGRLHRDPRHVRVRGLEAQPAGAAVHQPLL